MQLFEGRIDDERRLAWESQLLAYQKRFPSWDKWRKKIGSTSKDKEEEIRMAVESKNLFKEQAKPGDEEALAAFVAKE